MTKTLRLHLGCSHVHLDGWVNIDRRYLPGVDVVANIGILAEYQNETVDEIYCAHALDHFTRWEYPRVLKRWYDLLKPGGTLWISTPDFESIVNEYKCGTPLRELQGALYARQDYEDNVRHFIFDWEMLSGVLTNTGFSAMERTRSIGIGISQDCSDAKLPSGRLLSINVRAKK